MQSGDLLKSKLLCSRDGAEHLRCRHFKRLGKRPNCGHGHITTAFFHSSNIRLLCSKLLSEFSLRKASGQPKPSERNGAIVLILDDGCQSLTPLF